MNNHQTVVSPEAARADYARLYQTLGIDPKLHLITPQTLRVERALSASSNNYLFDFRENSSSDRPLENKLNQNDMFAMTHIALGITKQNESTTPKQYGNFKTLHTPDPNYFVGNGGNEHRGLNTLYNGKITIKTDNVDRLPEFPASILEYIPERGYTKLAAPQTQDEWPQRGPGLHEFFKLVPQVILNGQQNNSANLTLGQGDIINIAGGINPAGDGIVPETNVVVLLLHGFLISNAADPQLRWNII